MKLCLRCRRLHPRNAKFCGNGCGSIGGTRCVCGVVTPGRHRFCPECGSREVVEETPTINLGCLSRLVGWAIVLGSIRYACYHPDLIALAARSVFAYLFGMPGAIAWHFLTFLLQVVAWLWLAQLLWGRKYPDLLPHPSSVLRLLGYLLRGIWYGAKFLWALVEGAPRTERRPTLRQGREE